MWISLLEILLLLLIQKGDADRGDLEIPEYDIIIATTQNYWDYIESLNRTATTPTTQQSNTISVTSTTSSTQQPSTTLSTTTQKPTTTTSATAPTTMTTIISTKATKPTTRQPPTTQSSTLKEAITVTTSKSSTTVQEQKYVEQKNGSSDLFMTMKTLEIKNPSNSSSFDLPAALVTENPKSVKTIKDKSDNLNMIYIIAGCLAAVLVAIAAVTTTLFWLHSKGKLGSAGFLAVPQSA